jgi:hypothetical protein
MVNGDFDLLTCKPTLTIKATNGLDHIDLETIHDESLLILQSSKGLRLRNDQNYIDIETIMYGSDPLLQISQAIRVNDDINAYGFLGTSTDLNKSSGGGAIMMGHGLEYQTDPPRINLTDQGYNTLCLTTGSTYNYQTMSLVRSCGKG